MRKTYKITQSQLNRFSRQYINESYNSLDDLRRRGGELLKDRKMVAKMRDVIQDVYEYLDDVRTSGIVNMFQSSDLLWSGSDWIRKWADLHAPHLSDDDYDDDFNEHKEAFERVLENADYIRDLIIRYVIGETDDLNKINNEVKNVSRKLVTSWMKNFGSNIGRNYKTNTDESYELLEEDVDVVCGNCGHSWNTDENDPDPYLCHMCGYDQEQEDFFIDKVTEFWKNKKGVD